MHFPLCSAPMTYPQAVFCPRCGTGLPADVALLVNRNAPLGGVVTLRGGGS